jgi:glutaredoxin
MRRGWWPFGGAPGPETPAGGDPGDHSVTLITRGNCHLCEDAEQVLRRLAAELGFVLEEHDVDGDPALRDEYSDRVPVILIDGREHGYWRVEEPRFREALQRPRRTPR